MRKIIAIGESVLDTLLVNDQPKKTFVGGRIANAAASMGYVGVPTTMVSECCTDHVGDLIVKFLEDHKVDVKSIDRFTDGSTEISMIFENGDVVSQVNYGEYPADRFDVMWPRIDENDIVLFGSFYSIDEKLRERLLEMLTYAVERKAILIYLPGFQHGLKCRITKVMPAILENLELADFIVANNKDIDDIFPGEGVQKAFRNHLEFYCGNFVHIDENCNAQIYTRKIRETVSNPQGKSSNPLGWQAGFAAGLIYGLLRNNITRDILEDMYADTWNALMKWAFMFADEASSSADNTISQELGAKCGKEYADLSIE